MTRFRSLLPLVLLVVVLPGFSEAQLLLPTITVSGRDFDNANTCENAPDKCDGDPSLSTGLCEFNLYPSWQWASTDSVRFVLDWPGDWSVILWEACQAELVSGDPSARGSNLVFAYDECFGLSYDRPFFRMVVWCPTPGRFRIKEGIESHACGSEWIDEIFIHNHVEVGSYCGMLVYNSCGACPRELAGSFSPGSLSLILPAGDAHVDTIRVNGGWDQGDCPSWPEEECGGDDPSSCAGDVYDDESWISMALLESDGNHRVYQVMVSTLGLEAGDYEGRVRLSGNCVYCISTCMTVRLTVLHPSDAPSGPFDQPVGYQLDPIHPSPFHSDARISFRLPEPGRVTVRIYDVRGALVRTLVQGNLGGGRHQFVWSGVTDSGDEAPSGIYFVRLEADAFRKVRRMTLLR